jgi:hypothetical protein
MKRSFPVLVIVSAVVVTAPAFGQLTLPKSMKGNSNYQNQVNSAWSLSITKVNDDGSFEGTIDYEGRRCNAKKAPIANGKINDGDVRFNASMGAQCSDNTFILRRGKEHFLEGELRSNVAPLPAQLWLDPDS